MLQIHIFVALGGTMKLLVRLDRVEFSAHHTSGLSFNLVEQGVNNFGEHEELSDLRIVLLLLHEVILHQVNVGD